VSSAGAGLLSNADQGHFVWQKWTGDGTLIARIASVSPAAPGALAGVMFRETFGAGARSVAAVLTSSEGAALCHRAEPGTPSTLGTARAVAAPRWLRIIRKGSRFNTAVSADGLSWQSLGGVNLLLPATCKVGLFVSSKAGAESATAVFDSVSLTGGSPGFGG
jgi:hypothetical protein